jgi:hexokinase
MADKISGKSLGKTERSFAVSTKDMRKIISSFHVEIKRGLAGKKSSLAMIPSYVCLPTGLETGQFIALDLGGTNFRILGMELKGARKLGKSRIMKFTIPNKEMTGKGRELFDFLASSIKIFLGKYSARKAGRRYLGFTFSFPIAQTAIARGKLLHWTKGFSASGVVGKDPVKLLEEALERNGIRAIKVAALANDTVGTLAAGSYEDPLYDVGVIIGTGTNACYPEKSLGMIVNTEWGNFNKLGRTKYDTELDKSSSNPGRQILEKMVSGMYLGPLAQRVLAGFSIKAAGLKTEHMSEIEADGTGNLRGTAKVLSRLGVKSASVATCHSVRRICQIVSCRSARISAACIAAIITRMDPGIRRRHKVAMDGTVYEKHPTFAKEITAALEDLFGSKSGRISISMVKDGSGTGAAVIAAVAARTP